MWERPVPRVGGDAARAHATAGGASFGTPSCGAPSCGAPGCGAPECGCPGCGCPGCEGTASGRSARMQPACRRRMADADGAGRPVRRRRARQVGDPRPAGGSEPCHWKPCRWGPCRWGPGGSATCQRGAGAVRSGEVRSGDGRSEAVRRGADDPFFGPSLGWPVGAERAEKPRSGGWSPVPRRRPSDDPSGRRPSAPSGRTRWRGTSDEPTSDERATLSCRSSSSGESSHTNDTRSTVTPSQRLAPGTAARRPGRRRRSTRGDAFSRCYRRRP